MLTLIHSRGLTFIEGRLYIEGSREEKGREGKKKQRLGGRAEGEGQTGCRVAVPQ